MNATFTEYRADPNRTDPVTGSPSWWWGLGTDESADGFGGLLQFDLRFFGVAHGDDAVFEVLVEQHERDAFHGAGGRGDLGEDVDAVGLLVDEALQAAYLTFDATQPREDRLLLGDVSRVRVVVHGGAPLVVRLPQGGISSWFPSIPQRGTLARGVREAWVTWGGSGRGIPDTMTQ